MVIGMKYGRTRLDDFAAKEKTCGNTAVHGRVRRRNHSVSCLDLIGHDLSTPEGLVGAREEKLFHEKCTKYVRDAGEILETLL